MCGRCRRERKGGEVYAHRRALMEHCRGGDLPRHEQGHDRRLDQIRPAQGLPHRAVLAHPAAGCRSLPRGPAPAAPGPVGTGPVRRRCGPRHHLQIERVHRHHALQAHTGDDRDRHPFETAVIVVYPRTVYTDLNGLWLLGEWHEVRRELLSHKGCRSLGLAQRRAIWTTPCRIPCRHASVHVLERRPV
jgi:hypothetical protein